MLRERGSFRLDNSVFLSSGPLGWAGARLAFSSPLAMPPFLFFGANLAFFSPLALCSSSSIFARSDASRSDPLKSASTSLGAEDFFSQPMRRQRAKITGKKNLEGHLQCWALRDLMESSPWLLPACPKARGKRSGTAPLRQKELSLPAPWEEVFEKNRQSYRRPRKTPENKSNSF